MWLFLSGFESNIALRASVDTEEVKEKGKAEMLRTIKPLYVVWESTTLCNLRCRHCYSNAASLHPGLQNMLHLRIFWWGSVRVDGL